MSKNIIDLYAYLFLSLLKYIVLYKEIVVIPNNKYQDFTYFSEQTTEHILKEFNTSLEQGLSDEEAKKRLTIYGYNQIKEHEVSWLHILIQQLSSPFIFVFFIIALMYLFLADITHTIIVLAIICVNTLIGFYQEFNVEHNIRLLKKYLISYALVRRGGKNQKIISNLLVPGDIIILYPGDIIPADCRIIQNENLMIDESALTGESSPAAKTSTVITTPVKDFFSAHNIGFAGTTISSGKAIGVIIATGVHTQLGTIAYLTTKTIRESNLVKSTINLARFIFQLILITLVITFILNFFLKHGATNFSVLDLFIFSTSLAISAIPEALPIVITFCLSQGASVLAKNKVIVKRLSAIEDLGSIEILCTDKTGTLTENNMTVSHIYQNNNSALLYSAYVIPNKSALKTTVPGFDSAIWRALQPDEQKKAESFIIKKEIPFDSITRKNVVVGQEDNNILLIVRGTIEVISTLCTLQPEQKKNMQQWALTEEQQGSRVLAVAKKVFTLDQEQMALDTIKNLSGLALVGLVSFIDPIKKTAFDAVKKAKELGVHLKVLSGDSSYICQAVAKQLGIISAHEQVINGTEYAQADAQNQYNFAYEYNVFSRVMPEQKYSIITDLQQHYLVGYLGDGINDAPALKSASVSLAVQDAADVAREAADIILLKKSLHVIIDGIREGRKIFINTLKYITITMAANFGNFFSLAIASLLLNYLPMLPFQLLLLNLLSDFPMIAIATDMVDPMELKEIRKFNIKDIAFITIILGCVSSFFDFVIFVLFRSAPEPAQLQTAWFISSVLTELVLIFSLRTKLFFLTAKRPSLILTGLSIITAAITIVLPFTPFGQNSLKFVPLARHNMLIIFGIVGIYFITTELVKLIFYHTIRKPKENP